MARTTKSGLKDINNSVRKLEKRCQKLHDVEASRRRQSVAIEDRETQISEYAETLLSFSNKLVLKNDELKKRRREFRIFYESESLSLTRRLDDMSSLVDSNNYKLAASNKLRSETEGYISALSRACAKLSNRRALVRSPPSDPDHNPADSEVCSIRDALARVSAAHLTSATAISAYSRSLHTLRCSFTVVTMRKDSLFREVSALCDERDLFLSRMSRRLSGLVSFSVPPRELVDQRSHEEAIVLRLQQRLHALSSRAAETRVQVQKATATLVAAMRTARDARAGVEAALNALHDARKNGSFQNDQYAVISRERMKKEKEVQEIAADLEKTRLEIQEIRAGNERESAEIRDFAVLLGLTERIVEGYRICDDLESDRTLPDLSNDPDVVHERTITLQKLEPLQNMYLAATDELRDLRAAL